MEGREKLHWLMLWVARMVKWTLVASLSAILMAQFGPTVHQPWLGWGVLFYFLTAVALSGSYFSFVVAGADAPPHHGEWPIIPPRTFLLGAAVTLSLFSTSQLCAKGITEGPLILFGFASLVAWYFAAEVIRGVRAHHGRPGVKDRFPWAGLNAVLGRS